LEFRIEHELSLARLFQARFQALTGGSTLGFLSTVITNFDENQARDVDVARSVLEAHMTKFENIRSDLYKVQGRILNLEGVGKACREIEGMIAAVKELISSLGEVFEVALIEPPKVLLIHT
jgi:hypothetical protein